MDINIISQYLDNLSIQHKVDVDKNKIRAVIQNDDNNKQLYVHIRFHKELSVFQIIVQGKPLDELAALTDEQRVLVYKWMLEKNYTKLLGTFSYDPDDHDSLYTISRLCLEKQIGEEEFNIYITLIKNLFQSLTSLEQIISSFEDTQTTENVSSELLEAKDPNGNTQDDCKTTIVNIFDQAGMKYKYTEDSYGDHIFRLGFKTDVHLDSDGDNSVLVSLDLNKDQSRLRVETLGTYFVYDKESSEEIKRTALLKIGIYALLTTYKYKNIQIWVDPLDGEVRYRRDYILAQSHEIIRDDLMDFVENLVSIVDKNDEIVKNILNADLNNVTDPIFSEIQKRSFARQANNLEEQAETLTKDQLSSLNDEIAAIIEKYKTSEQDS